MEQMKDVKFMTAKEKEAVLKAWERFMRAMAGGKTAEELSRMFTEALYHHLIQHCSFIAHYNRAGFFQHYFEEPEKPRCGPRQGAPGQARLKPEHSAPMTGI